MVPFKVRTHWTIGESLFLNIITTTPPSLLWTPIRLISIFYYSVSSHQIWPLWSLEVTGNKTWGAPIGWTGGEMSSRDPACSCWLYTIVALYRVIYRLKEVYATFFFKWLFSLTLTFFVNFSMNFSGREETGGKRVAGGKKQKGSFWRVILFAGNWIFF